MAIASGLVMFLGLTLALSVTRWFGRTSIVERLRPYTPGGAALGSNQGLFSVDSFRDVVAPFPSDWAAAWPGCSGFLKT
ncbi:MAG: hypothetical protein ACR2PK_09955 [Acidimicrobiales bacterium]